MLALTTLAPRAAAEERYAIVIGANRGEVDEAVLRFAERDAQRVGDVLGRLGGVAPEDLLTLLSPDRGGLERALSGFKTRIRDPREAVLVVYYSGHADAQTLHLGGSKLSFSELKAGIRGLGVGVSVLVLDACRSGGIMRQKGGKQVKAFDFAVQDELASQGMAIITSSAETEDAQESDRLEGGVFTHHFVTGLIGAADASKDEKVSLAEAYRYAYEQTLAATSTSDVVQHPSYAFDVTGQHEVVLTQLGDLASRALLRFDDPGRYLVLDHRGGVVAELGAATATEISLAPGGYLVRRREPDAVYERAVRLEAGVVRPLAADDFTRVPFRHAVRKGYGLVERRALSLGLDTEGASALFGSGLMGFVAIAGQVDWADLAVRTRLRFGWSQPDHTTLDASQSLLGVDVGIYHLFDVGAHGVGFGLRAGADWLAQRFETTGDAPDVNQIIGRVGPFGRVELALGGSIALQLDVGVEVYVLDVAGAPGSRSEVAARVLPTATLGLAFALR